MATELTAEQLRGQMIYSPETGVFTRLVGSNAGKVAGCVNKALGYGIISVLGKSRYAHRLAWLYMHGEWPRHQIDHINGDRADNRIANLRDVPERVNHENKRRAQSNSTSGLLGANKHGAQWRARIKSGGAFIHLGVYDTPHEAHRVFVEAKRRLHEGSTL